MINIDEVRIKNLIVHRIASENGKSILTDKSINLSEEDGADALKKIFLQPFLAITQTFEFNHEISLDYNILYNLSKEIYEGSDFIEQSQGIAQLLISTSTHHNIKDGDLFVLKLEDVKLGSSFYEGVAICKYEDKDSFIETPVNKKSIEFNVRKGISGKKPDKACLIIFTKSPFTIIVIDSNKEETEYWQKDFINHKPKEDDVNHTNNFMSLTKKFITTQMPSDFDVSKADQIDLLNRSVEYFKTHDDFTRKGFEHEVLQDKGIIRSFGKFNEIFSAESDLEIADHFSISPQVVKKQARAFKSVLKLDNNFHVYIHGNRELIEQGIEKDGRKYYKLYYDSEV